jgi:hypothetical protein
MLVTPVRRQGWSKSSRLCVMACTFDKALSIVDGEYAQGATAKVMYLSHKVEVNV